MAQVKIPAVKHFRRNLWRWRFSGRGVELCSLRFMNEMWLWNLDLLYFVVRHNLVKYRDLFFFEMLCTFLNE